MKSVLAALMVLASLAAAHAFGLGKEGFMFGRLGAPSKGGTPAPPLTNLRITDTGAFRITDTGANRAVSP